MFYTQRVWLFFALSAAVVCAMPPAHAAARVTFEKDLVYATVDGVDLLYDFAKPPEGNGPFPFVLCIHAGGWQLGNKKSYRGIVKELAGKGYAAATIEYRLTPDHKWPAQLEDVQRAVEFFRANAATHKIDRARIGVVGDDAGAHLALMLALVAARDDAGKPLEQSHRVQAVVNFFAPLDLREWRVNSSWVETLIRIGFMKAANKSSRISSVPATVPHPFMWKFRPSATSRPAPRLYSPSSARKTRWCPSRKPKRFTPHSSKPASRKNW